MIFNISDFSCSVWINLFKLVLRQIKNFEVIGLQLYFTM